MRLERRLQRLWLMSFWPQRAEFYRDLADMFRRNEALMGFFEGEIANAVRTGQRARAAALRRMLARYQSGDHAGRLGHLLEAVVPRGDTLMLVGVDRADDKAAALRALATAVDQQVAMRRIVAGHAAFPAVMLPLCYVLIRILGDVILAIDQGTPEPVKDALWAGAHGWARTLATFTQAHGLTAVTALAASLLLLVFCLPRWRGRGRLWVEGWPVFGLYRNFQAGLLFSSLAMLLTSGVTLKAALEDTAQRSSPWMRWHITRVLRALDDSPTGTLDAFSRGILSPRMLARAATLQRTATSFSDVLVDMGTREGDRVLEAVRQAARLTNAVLVGVLLAVCAFLGVATLSVPGRFSTLMEPATLMSLKQAHDAKVAGPPP